MGSEFADLSGYMNAGVRSMSFSAPIGQNGILARHRNTFGPLWVRYGRKWLYTTRPAAAEKTYMQSAIL